MSRKTHFKGRAGVAVIARLEDLVFNKQAETFKPLK
jgi:hypothetical protein